jgi:hypothetical protein
MNKFPFVLDHDMYYLVNNQKVYSKVEAIAIAQGDMSKISWHWMEKTWDNIDWTTEPDISWEELLRIRCQQIRDKYSYLALWYSSGYDSHTILHSFIKNKLIIDELLIYDRRDFFDDPEIEFAIAHANYIKNTYYPNLKINVVRVSADAVAAFYTKMGDEWIYHPNCSLKLAKTMRYFSTTLMEDFLSTTKLTHQRGNIMGVDKPKFMFRDNAWYAFCPDVAVDCIGSDQENFYISAELPELHIKQCHMTLKWFESLPELNEDLVHDIQGRNRADNTVYTKYYQDWNLAMGRYPLYHSHLFSINGAMKYFHTNDETSPDNINLLNYIKNNDKRTFKIYTHGLSEIKKLAPNGTISTLANKTFVSKQYYIKNRNILAH